MKKLVALVLFASLVVGAGYAQATKMEGKKQATVEAKKWHGYVVDAMCAKGMAKKDNPMERAAKHTKDCALEEGCAASGYGLFSEGKYYKFDEAGDKLAKSAIEKSTQSRDLMFDVTGKMEGDKILVASLTEMKMDGKESGKMMEGKKHGSMDGHKH
jgi:hypothetical protein